MATSIVEHFDVEPSHASLQFWGCPAHESAVATNEGDELSVSTSAALGGARASMVAIGIEAVAALCLFGFWQVWHHLR